MPPVHAGAYLLDYFWQVGPVQSGGMGPAPISYQEICAWQSLMGIVLQPWEVRALRRLSIEHISTGQKATERGYPAPWQAETFTPEPVADHSPKNALRALAKL